jgi:hypothetical protein
MLNNTKPDGCVDICPPVRNRYFYGKLLDVFHFELEQNYFNAKRWMLNRLVAGYGVICGLDVQLSSDQQSIIVTPGIAIDKCGHEIMLCQPSGPHCLPTPPQATTTPNAPVDAGKQPAGGTTPATGAPASANAPPNTSAPSPGMEGWDCGKFVHVLLCYHECQSDPVPAMGGDCDTQALCAPGAIRESYRIEVREGKCNSARTTSRITDIIVNGSLNYAALANFVTSQNCQNGCSDCCCIPLASIRIPDPGQTYDPAKSIDISVRPICYTNDLLYEMILAMRPGQSQPAAGKP